MASPVEVSESYVQSTSGHVISHEPSLPQAPVLTYIHEPVVTYAHAPVAVQHAPVEVEHHVSTWLFQQTEGFDAAEFFLARVTFMQPVKTRSSSDILVIKRSLL
jgi:hypothetical protein